MSGDRPTTRLYNRFGRLIEGQEETAELAKRFGARPDHEPHGLRPPQIEALDQKYRDVRANTSTHLTRNQIEELLPEGRFLDARTAARSGHKSGQVLPGWATGGSGGGGWGGGPGGTFFSNSQPYMPEFECLLGDTPVRMADGTEKSLEEIEVGERVLDRTGRIQTVERAWCSGVPETLVEVKLWGNQTLYSTENHKWPVFAWARECQCGCGEEVKPGRLYVQNHYKGGASGSTAVHVRGSKQRSAAGYMAIPEGYEPVQKIRADEIRVKDFLLIPRKFDHVETETSEDEARLLGYYVAEGVPVRHAAERGGALYAARWCFGEHEKETWVADVESILRERGQDFSTAIYSDRGACVVTLTNERGEKTEATQGLTRWLLDNAGEGSHTKKFSEEVMRWPVKLKRELLKGMFRGDGTRGWRSSTKIGKEGKSFSVVYGTASKVLADQTQLLLAHLGIPSRRMLVPACERDVGAGHISECAEFHHVIIPPPYAYDFARFVWGEESGASDHEVKNVVRPECMVDDDFIYVPIKSVKVIENERPVYNMTVSGDHSYLVGNYIATYNSSDRQSYPIHRRLANSYWRLFYKMDPIIGAVLDLFADLPWSDFQLTGEGVEGEVKARYEQMINETNLRSILPVMVREFFIIGEVIPHLYFDNEKGMWTYIALHNPDQINVVYSPFIKMDTLMEFVPDPRLRELVNSTHPMLSRVRENMPSELVSRLRSGENIPLSPVNASFLPRKMHPYDLRGTSIISRLWRTLMLEDAIFEATTQTARRAASPLKLIKLGDPTTGVVPSPQEESRVLQLLAQAEADPQCFVPSTPVSLGNGSTRPIGELKVGDVVLDRTGVPREVAALRRETSPDLVRIHPVGMPPIECTPTHKWPIFGFPRTCQCGCGEKIKRGNFAPQHGGKNGLRGVDRSYWSPRTSPTKRRGARLRFLEGFDPIQKLRADDIHEDDYLLVPRTFNEKIPEGVTPEKARLLGYYAAEGCPRNVYERKDGSIRSGVDLSFGDHELDTHIKDVQEIVEGLCGYKPYVNHQDKGRTVVVCQNASSDLCAWLARMCPGKARTKHLHPEVLSWPLDLKYQFMVGYVGGDGCSTLSRVDAKARYVAVSSASSSLVDQVRLLLIQLGTYPSFFKRTQSEQSFGPGNTQYGLHIYGEMASRLSKDAWNLNQNFENSHTQWWMDDEFVYVPIQKIETVESLSGEPFEVVNMTVSVDHSYIAGGFSTYNSYLVYNYQISHELVGAPERVMSINQHYDLIERIKLAALGVSKSFISGETSFSSAASGLTIFLQRLKALREQFMNEWVIPKYFFPVAVANGWVKAEKGSAGGHLRVKRSFQELYGDDKYIIPEVEWEKSLDPTVDQERISAMDALENSLQIKISDQKKYACVGLDPEEEQKQIVQEVKFKRELAGQDPEVAMAIGLVSPDQMTGGGGGGGGGALMSPGIPPEAFGMGEGEGDLGGEEPPPTGDEGPIESPSPETGAEKEGEEGATTSPGESSDPQAGSRARHWSSSTLQPLLGLFQSFELDAIDDEPWVYMKKDRDVQEAVDTGDPRDLWFAVEQWLIEEGYPSDALKELEGILTARRVLKNASLFEGISFEEASTQLGVTTTELEDEALFVGVK